MNFRTNHVVLAKVVILFFSSCLLAGAQAFSCLNIGCGDPALKVIAKQWNSNAIVIYRELPGMPFGGFTGVWMTNENIHVIADHGFHFHKDMDSFTAGIPLQLYPFALNAAFTDEAGERALWYPTNYWIADLSRDTCYTLTNGTLTFFGNVQQVARARYHLGDDEIFLGSIDNRVFFCKNSYRPDKVFWREQGNQTEYYYHLPGTVCNVYGVTTPVHSGKDVGFVVLRRTPLVWPPWDNLFLPPRSDYFIEISLSKGKLMCSGE